MSSFSSNYTRLGSLSLLRVIDSNRPAAKVGALANAFKFRSTSNCILPAIT